MKRYAALLGFLFAFVGAAAALTPGQKAAISGGAARAVPAASLAFSGSTVSSPGVSGVGCPTFTSCLYGGSSTQNANIRASNATMTDSTGALTYGPNNLLFPTTSWATQTVTVASGANYLLTFTVPSTATITGSSGCVFAAVGGSAGPFIQTFTTTGTSCILTLGGSGGVTNPILAAVTYETTARPADSLYCGVTTATACYGPRFDWTGGTANGLLLEEQRTNLALWSNVLTNAVWNTYGTTVSSQAILAPDGTTGVSLVQNDTSLSYHQILQNLIVSSSSTNTSSVYVKQYLTNRYIVLKGSDNVSQNYPVLFDLQTGTVIGNATGYVAYVNSIVASSIINVGNGWYRLSVTYGTDNTTGQVGISVSNGSNPATAGNFFYTGNTTQGVYMWGGQGETAAFPSAFIPTTTATVTRSADIVVPTGPLLTTIEGSKGSIVFKTTSGANANASNAAYLLYDATNSKVFLGSDTASHGQTTLGATLTTSNTATWGVEGATNANDLGLAWGTGKGIIDLNGTITSDTTTRSPGTSFYVGSNNGANNFWDGAISSIAAYNTQLAGPQ